MQLNSYLFFDGNCREAFESYARILGGHLTAMMRYAESPEAKRMDAADRDRVMHACLEVDGHRLMASDVTADQAYEGIRHVSVTVNLDSVERAREIFDALAEGGEILMPFDKTFWARGFGSVVDRHGVSWMVNCE